MRFWGRLGARLALILVLFVSGIEYEGPQLIIAAFVVGVSAVMLSLKRYRKHLLGNTRREGGSLLELEDRLASVEELQEHRGMGLEDQYHDRLAELEERQDFTERLLATQREPEGFRTPV